MFNDLFSEYGATVLGGALFLAAAWVFGWWADKILGQMLRKQGKIDPSSASLMARFVRFSILVFAGIVVLQELGVEVASLIAALGIFGFAIAIGLRTTSTNFFTGIMLIALKPYKVGDFIEGERVEGVVESVNLFHTVVITKDGVYVAVPNAAMWARSVSNFSRIRPRCIEIDVTVEHGVPFGELRGLTDDVLKAESMVSAGFEPLIRIIDVKVKTMTIRAAFWCDAEHEHGVRDHVSDTLRTSLTAAGAVVKKISSARKTTPKKKVAPPTAPPSDGEG